MRPGLTGYAQVHGRNSITWEERFDYDVYYTNNITFLGDWKIILQTILTVLKRDGISSGNSVTMGKRIINKILHSTFWRNQPERTFNNMKGNIIICSHPAENEFLEKTRIYIHKE